MENLNLLGALAIAITLGSIVGIEREANNHPAGIRTHALVCVGSALITLVSWQTYISFNYAGDPTRIAAQIISGIGFLGAGTIMREGATIKGLTTAASLWTVAAIGLAVGYGYYLFAISTTFLAVIVLYLFQKWEKIFMFTKQHLSIKIVVEDKLGMLGYIGFQLSKLKVDIKNITMEPHGRHSLIVLDLKLPPKVKHEVIVERLYDMEGVIKVEYQD